MKNYQNLQPPVNTPWGINPDKEFIANGLFFLSSPSHGGYWVSTERYDDMPTHLKICSFTQNQFFEEDCSWCAVVLAFPDAFKPDQLAMAEKTYSHHYAKKQA